jgi:hypothetical protein
MRYPLPEAICRTKEPQPATDLASCWLLRTVRLTSPAEKFRYISELEEIGPANRDAYFLISAPGVEMVDTSFASSPAPSMAATAGYRGPEGRDNDFDCGLPDIKAAIAAKER